MASWLGARWFLGGELVGGETPGWRDDRQYVHLKDTKNKRENRKYENGFFLNLS